MAESFVDMLRRLSEEIRESGNFNNELEKKHISEASYLLNVSSNLFSWYCSSRCIEKSEINSVLNMSFDFTPELRDEMKRSFCLLNDSGREGYWEWIWQCIVEEQLDRRKPDNLKKMRRDRFPPSF